VAVALLVALALAPVAMLGVAAVVMAVGGVWHLVTKRPLGGVPGRVAGVVLLVVAIPTAAAWWMVATPTA